MRDVERGVAQRLRGRGARAAARPSGSDLASRSNRRAPSSRSLARSSAPWPASIFVVTAWCQVASGSLHASTAKVHSAGAVGDDGRRASGRCPARPGPSAISGALRPAGSRSTTLAPTASWPSRKTRRRDRDRLADRAVRRDARRRLVEPTTGVMSESPKRPTTRFNLPRLAAHVAAGRKPLRRWRLDAIPEALSGLLACGRVKALRRLDRPRRVCPPQLDQLGELVDNLRWSWHPESLDLLESVDPGPVARLQRRPGSDARRGQRRAARRAGQGPQVPAPARRRPRRPDRLPDRSRAGTRTSRTTGRAAARRRSATSRRSSASPRCCRSTPAASASWPATTSRPPATSACRSSASACSTAPATSASRCRRDGWQLEHYPSLDPRRPADPARSKDADGAPVRVAIALPEARTLHAQVWVAQVGRVPLLLLDTDIEENDAAARQVTDRLYGGGTRAPARAGAAARRRRRAGDPRLLRGHRRRRARGVPHQRGPRRLPRRRAHPRARRGRRPRLRRGAAGGAGRHGVHHAHPGAGRHRPVRPRPGRRAPRPAWPACRSSASSTLGAEDDPTHVQHGAHGAAARPARQRRLAAARRGQPRDVQPTCGRASTPTRCRSRSVTNGVHAPTWMAREILEIAEREVGAAVARRAAAAGRRSTRSATRELWSVRNTLRERLVGEIRRRVRASVAASAA